MIISDELLLETKEKETKRKKSSKIKKDKRQKREKNNFKSKKGKSILSFLPFRRIISEDCIALRNAVTDYLLVEEFSVKNGSAEDRASAINDFGDFLRIMNVDHKFIFTSYPADMTENLEYAMQRFNVENENDSEYVLEEKKFAKKQLDYLHQNKMIEEVYLQIFADEETDLQEIQESIRGTQGMFFRISPIKLEKKVKLIHRLYNLGDTIIQGNPYTGNDYEGRPLEAQKIVEKDGYDPIFIGQIQPLGNIKTNASNYIQTSTGYLRILHLTNYKRKGNYSFWGDKVFKFPNVTTSVDIFNVDKENADFERSLNRSLSEYEDRIETSKDKISRKKAIHEYSSLDRTVDDILETDEVLKQVHVRYFLHEPTLELLNQKETDIKNRLKKQGFQCNCFLDECQEEYEALFVSYSQNQKRRKRKGQEIKGQVLSGSYPFSYTKLIDNDALYSGYAIYGSGIACINQFHKDRSRKSYNGWYVGNQGFGKSTAIKYIAKQNRLLGNNSYLFMVSNEAQTFVEAAGGKHIDARDPRINPCQIYVTDVDTKTGDTLERDCYSTNLTKIKIIIAISSGIKGSASKTLAKSINQFYDEWIDRKGLDINKITQYAPEQYPLYSHMLERFQEKYQSETEEFVKKDLYDIIMAMEEMITNNQNIFNNYTEFDLQDEKLVAFNLESLLKADSNIYNAQYFNLYNMVFSHAVKVGQREKYLYQTGQKSVKEIVYTDLVSDEFHNPIRYGNIDLLHSQDRLSREGRKIFIGQHYAVHDINDCFPDMDDKGGMGAISKAVMNLYKMSTYRFIFRQDSSSLATLEKVFGKEISQSDLEEITRLDEGELLLNIKGTTNIKFKYDISSRDEKIFEGGV